VFWLFSVLWTRNSDGFRLLDAITGAAVLFGLTATVLSYGPRPWTFPPTEVGALQLKMLKFYPFRLADVMAALIVACGAARLWNIGRAPHWLTGVVGLAFIGAAVVIPGPDRAPGMLSGATRQDWITTLKWVRDNVPADALLLAANEDFGVKWWAQRPEYVNFKDCPQDARGVVEWNARLLAYTGWTRDTFGDQVVSSSDLRELGRRTGATHLIVSRLGPVEAQPLYERGRFKVFELHPAAAAVPGPTP